MCLFCPVFLRFHNSATFKPCSYFFLNFFLLILCYHRNRNPLPPAKKTQIVFRLVLQRFRTTKIFFKAVSVVLSQINPFLPGQIPLPLSVPGRPGLPAFRFGGGLFWGGIKYCAALWNAVRNDFTASVFSQENKKPPVLTLTVIFWAVFLPAVVAGSQGFFIFPVQ